MGGLGVSYRTQNTNTLLRGHVSQIRPCRVTYIPTGSTLPQTQFACMQRIKCLSKISAALILIYYRLFASDYVLNHIMSCDPVAYFSGNNCSVNRCAVCSCHVGKPHQNSRRRQSPVFDNKFLESQSVAKCGSEECVSEGMYHVQMACSWHDSSLSLLSRPSNTTVLCWHYQWEEAALHHNWCPYTECPNTTTNTPPFATAMTLYLEWFFFAGCQFFLKIYQRWVFSQTWCEWIRGTFKFHCEWERQVFSPGG